MKKPRYPPRRNTKRFLIFEGEGCETDGKYGQKKLRNPKFKIQNSKLNTHSNNR